MTFDASRHERKSILKALNPLPPGEGRVRAKVGSRQEHPHPGPLPQGEGAVAETDICLFLEGTYPYVTGGVAGWTHDLIRQLPEHRFHLVVIEPPGGPRTLRYALPPNVTDLQHITLQRLPMGDIRLPKAKEQAFFARIERPLLELQSIGSLSALQEILHAMQETGAHLGQHILLDSEACWTMLLRMYHATFGNSPFLDYFWTWRGLLGSLYAILLAPLPKARVYHALCTGYAGLAMARARLETGAQAVLTEHGIYTNERRIEMIAADWLQDRMARDLAPTTHNRELRDFWTDAFGCYARVCYEASDRILTLYEENRLLQIDDGADAARVQVIPNGIEVERFAHLGRDTHHPPTIALIGRVVPIKDVKTFIRAVALLRERIPELRAWILGPMDEDSSYAAECQALSGQLGLLAPHSSPRLRGELEGSVSEEDSGFRIQDSANHPLPIPPPQAGEGTGCNIAPHDQHLFAGEAFPPVPSPAKRGRDREGVTIELSNHPSSHHPPPTLSFLGRVKVEDYLPQIDVVVLTSLSEVQPLVILEAGAAGIPLVTTDVGACREMLLGREDESPRLGAGGMVCPLSNPSAIAQACARLLTQPALYQSYADSLRTRVHTHYRLEDQVAAYRGVYGK